MAQNINEYWDQKEQNAYKARKHTKEMKEKYSKEIDECINTTLAYASSFVCVKGKGQIPKIDLIDADSVTAIFNEHSKNGKMCVLNFASFKEPGGRFIDGSVAQEEALCHESFLYNVLKEQTEFYEWNKKNLNYSQYKNHALYSSDVIFERNGEKIKCDVLTCAAPNITPAKKYGFPVTEAQNYINLGNRISYILDVAESNYVDTLILGAYGCGVFGQDPKIVCEYFLQFLNSGKYMFKNIIFAIPKTKNGNYEAFEKTMNERGI